MRKLRDVGANGPWTTVLLHLLPEDPLTGRETDEPFYAFYNFERPHEMTYVVAKTGRAVTGDETGLMDGLVGLMGNESVVAVE